MKRNIEDIRIAKGFETAGEFAKYIGMAGPNYSQVATGKKSVTQRMVMKLKKKFPDDDFSDLISKNDTKITHTQQRGIINTVPLKFRGQLDTYREYNFRPLPVIKPLDRAELPALLKGDMRDIEFSHILHENLQTPRADYFVLEIGQEPYTHMYPGDRLLCYEVRAADWWRVSAGSLILIYSTARPDLVVKVHKNNLFETSPGTLVCDGLPLTWVFHEIKHIYQIDALYRKL